MGKVELIGNAQRDGVNYRIYATASLLREKYKGDLTFAFVCRKLIEIKTA
jgi:hypothetical protein